MNTAGFPFGHYYFTGVMGPKLFQLPILLALAYLSMGYLSWINAVVLLGPRNQPERGTIMASTTKGFPRSHWLLAVLFYGVSAAGNVLLSVPSAATAALITDTSGRAWRVSDIIANCTLASVFTMGAFTFIAGARLWQVPQSGNVSSSTTAGT